ISGIIEGEAEGRGSPARPEGRYALSFVGVATPETRKAGLHPLDAKASGTLNDGRASINARVSAGLGGEENMSGSLPIDLGGPLTLRAQSSLDAALANTFLAAGGQRLTGRVVLDGRINGTLSAPRVEGVAALKAGTFTDPLQGIRLTNIDGQVT